MQNYRQGASLASRSQFVAEVLEQEEGWALVEVKNRFQLGDELTLVTPSGNMAFDLTQMQDRDGKPLETAPGSGWQVRIPLPQSAGEYALLTRTLT
ncbi:U32 family peptidase C-terminal domain-containing protein, partial [Thiolapillus sp.]